MGSFCGPGGHRCFGALLASLHPPGPQLHAAWPAISPLWESMHWTPFVLSSPHTDCRPVPLAGEVAAAAAPGARVSQAGLCTMDKRPLPWGQLHVLCVAAALKTAVFAPLSLSAVCAS